MKPSSKIFLMFLMIFLYGDQSKSQVIVTSVDSTALFRYEWDLFCMRGTNLLKLDLSRFPSLLFYPKNLKAYSGCSFISTPYKRDKYDHIRFLNINESRPGCIDEDIHKEFIRMLQKVDKYKVYKHELRFFSQGILIARFYANYSGECYDQAAALKGEWLLTFMAGTNDDLKKLFPEEHPSIIFPGTSSEKIKIFSGLRHCESQFDISLPDKLRLENIDNPDTQFYGNRGEEIFLNHLSNVTNFSLGNDVLYLRHGGGVLMQLNRKNNVLLSKGAANRFLEKKSRKTIYSE